MAAELRSFYSPDYIQHIARCLSEESGINALDFAAFCLAPPWDEMTLKERMGRITEGLVCFLPGPFANDIRILKNVLPRVSGDAQKYADMLSMFIPNYVIQNTENDLDQSLEALRIFTSHGTTSELAIRPLIVQSPTKVMTQMLAWASHTHPHVRRFSSEGCRPRLPWAMALPDFKKDPSLIFPILETLRADDSKFVQKSVANNLNDIAKDNPELVLAFAKKWAGTHKNTDWILKTGCRTLLKQGNPKALALFGATPVKISRPKLAIANPTVQFGQSVELTFSALLDQPAPEILRIEYAIDFMKSNGKQSRKIFMISQAKPESDEIHIRKSHKFIDYTTRKHYPGSHSLVIFLNGQEVALQEFTLVM